MIALSIRQPWAWLILNAGKDIENRTWSTRVRGRVLVHAGIGCTKLEYDTAYIDAVANGVDVRKMPTWRAIERGGIVGSVEIVDCVATSTSPWFCGRYGFVLRDPQPTAFRPCKGALGFFEVE